MSPRQAFRIFIRHILEAMVDEGKIDLTAEDLEKFASGVEDDPEFYKSLEEAIQDFLDVFGENYGIQA